MRVIVSCVKTGNHSRGDSGKEYFPPREVTLHISNLESIEVCTTQACGRLPSRVEALRLRTKNGGYLKVASTEAQFDHAAIQAFIGGKDAEPVKVPVSYDVPEVRAERSWIDAEAEPFNEVRTLREVGPVLEDVREGFRSRW